MLFQPLPYYSTLSPTILALPYYSSPSPTTLALPYYSSPSHIVTLRWWIISAMALCDKLTFVNNGKHNNDRSTEMMWLWLALSYINTKLLEYTNTTTAPLVDKATTSMIDLNI